MKTSYWIIPKRISKQVNFIKFKIDEIKSSVLSHFDSQDVCLPRTELTWSRITFNQLILILAHRGNVLCNIREYHARPYRISVLRILFFSYTPCPIQLHPPYPYGDSFLTVTTCARGRNYNWTRLYTQLNFLNSG